MFARTLSLFPGRTGNLLRGLLLSRRSRAAGSTVPIVNALSGEISAAQIFVATLGASNYTFACATPRQTTADWIGAQVDALEFFGGVPRLIVPDQTRSLIKRPDRY